MKNYQLCDLSFLYHRLALHVLLILTSTWLQMNPNLQGNDLKYFLEKILMRNQRRCILLINRCLSMLFNYRIFCLLFTWWLFATSKQFRRRIRSIAVDGKDLIAAANDAYKKSLGRLEAKEAAAKAAAKREEERVEKLKKIRGERWLPSMAKEMQVKIKHKHSGLS